MATASPRHRLTPPATGIRPNVLPPGLGLGSLTADEAASVTRRYTDWQDQRERKGVPTTDAQRALYARALVRAVAPPRGEDGPVVIHQRPPGATGPTPGA